MENLVLHTTHTANGIKALILLEEFECDYDIRLVDLSAGEQFDPAFKKISPLSRIPVITFSADGEKCSVYGSEAIAVFLAEHSGRYLPAEGAARYRVLEAVSYVTSDIAAPLSAQFLVDFLVEGEHPAVIDFFNSQTTRLFTSINELLARSAFIAGEDYSIADMLLFPSVAISATRIPGVLDGLENLLRWRDAVADRAPIQTAMQKADADN